MASWEQVQQNTTLYPKALLAGEGASLRWHKDAHRPQSSQVFCVSAFGTLRHLPVRDGVIRQLLGLPDGATTSDPTWSIELEKVQADLLSEYGRVKASSVDALLLNRQAVFCVESKFSTDAKYGFRGCSQPEKDKNGVINCAGYYGPGSDLKTNTNAWCRLEIWDGDRSPRTYWTLGRAFFRESIFAKQADHEKCPFNGPFYQLMRNFLFAAALAQQKKLLPFGVVAIAPARRSAKLEQQLKSFRETVLQPQFGGCTNL